MKIRKLTAVFMFLCLLAFTPITGADDGRDYRFEYKGAMEDGALSRYVVFSSLGAQRWKDYAVVWMYNPNGQLVDTATALKAISAAQAAWEKVSGVRFVYNGITGEFTGDNGTLVIRWLDGPSFTAAYGNYAGYTYSYWDDQYFTGSTLSLNAAASDLAIAGNLQGLLVHELGHALGLDHSNVVESVMYANPYHDYTYMQTPRTDDIQASTYLYPTSAVRYYDSGILTLPRVEIHPGTTQYTGVNLQLNQAGNFALTGATQGVYNAQGISGEFENNILSLPEVDVHDGNTSVKYTGVKLVLRTDMTFSLSDGKQAQY